MEEFDIELDSDIGTSVSKIKNREQPVNIESSKHTDTDIDYDKVMEILHNSETKNSVTEPQKNIVYPPNQNPNQNIDKLPRYVQDVRPKREINMGQFVKNMENVLDNQNLYYRENNYGANEPLPANFTKNMINHLPVPVQKQSHPHPIEDFSQVPVVETIKLKQNESKVEPKKEPKIIQEQIKLEQDLVSKVFNFEYLDVIIYVLLFILLNNKFVIEFIYDRIPYVKTIDSPYPNLLIRGAVFGASIFLIKKFNL